MGEGSRGGLGAVVLAGAPNAGRLQAVSPVAYEALIPVSGRPMVAWVLQALDKVAAIREVVVVGPPALERVVGEVCPRARLVPAGDSLLANLERGVAALGIGEDRAAIDAQGISANGEREREGREVLIVTADIPLLRPEAVTDFLARCRQMPACLYYPIVRREVSEQAFPGVERTYVHLRDGVFTGGNLILLNAAIIGRCTALFRKVIAARKRPWELARLFGWRFIVDFLLRRLTIAALEGRAATLLGCPARAVITPYAEIGVDVDKPSDLTVTERALAERNQEDG